MILTPLATLFLLAALAVAQVPPGDWKTDWSKKSIDLSELVVSVAKDQFRSIDRPQFVSVEEASEWLSPQEPVMVFERGSQARAYPLQILLYHEIVNDEVGDVPVLVSFCPLCNSGVIFDRRIHGETYDFGVAGMLRHADMVMHDRQTESLWQQLTGEAIVGALTGVQLDVLTSQTVAFETFADSFPAGQVLSRNTGIVAPYGSSHYVGHEFGRRDMLPVPLDRPLPVPPMERIITVTVDGKSKAYPFSFLSKWPAYEDRINKQRFVIFFEPGMVSAMDSEKIAESRAVGAAGVFSPFVNGKRLRFRTKDGRLVDKQTNSVWNVMGVCIEGPLKGERLEVVEHGMFFAFAWMKFNPDTKWVGVPTAIDLLSQPPGATGQPPPVDPFPSGRTSQPF